MKRTKLLAAAVILFGSALSACGGYGAGYVAVGPPPAPRYGVIGYAPGPGYVWTDGYWNYTGHGWAWINGRWMRPPRGRHTWMRSEWRHEGGRWRYHEGHWR